MMRIGEVVAMQYGTGPCLKELTAVRQISPDLIEFALPGWAFFQQARWAGEAASGVGCNSAKIFVAPPSYVPAFPGDKP